jgi:hypothetical protein
MNPVRECRPLALGCGQPVRPCLPCKVGTQATKQHIVRILGNVGVKQLRSSLGWSAPRGGAGQAGAGRMVVVTAAAVTAAEEPKKESLFRPFKDPTANSRLLALCFAQALCSVATLIHDTYLPVYLSDVLKLSNTKVMTVLLRDLG